jgi:glycosyltransferase family protein
MDVVRAVSQMNEAVEKNSQTDMILYNRLRNLPYEIFDYRQKDKYKIPQIMTIEETIDEIVRNNKSIARFGDGEFGIMFGIQRWRFQRNDERLAERLREVVTSQDDNILIGINDFYGDLSHRTESDAEGIRSYITPEIRAQHMELLRTDRLYANAVISRTGTMEKVRNQKRIWEGKDCVFIEGDKTRMGVGNDLFNNAKSIQRILCPAESAFDNYDAILEEAKKLPRDKTILIALGPTASVLAYDLAKAGYHAIDIGHADLSYEWLLRNGGPKTAVSNKYNNEWQDGYLVEDIHDEVYESQIIADLSK